MSVKSIRSAISRNLFNIPGWRTNRKIVVIESDDWGSIRMPSRAVYDIMLSKGYPVDIRHFEKYDSLATSEDMEALYKVLRSFRDKNGNHPVFTANTIMTNPAFERIRASNFTEYHNELFTETLKKYNNDAFLLWLQGINEKIFHPQYHGREHFNISRWMHSLQMNSPNEMYCFDHGMVGIPSQENPENGNQLMITLQFDTVNQFAEQKKALIEGYNLFNQLFGYKSESFIAPVYTWNSLLEKELADLGVKYIQGSKFQKEPCLPDGHIKLTKHILGQKNSYGQIYLVRNIFFDPSTCHRQDYVRETEKRINAAFFWHKPAIISSHRLNYIGSIHPENRTRSLIKLNELLLSIIRKWPQVEFMTSDQLGDLISQNIENENCYS